MNVYQSQAGVSENNRYQADIYGENIETKKMFIIEVALVGISTQDKWLRKIEKDRAKLSTFIPDDSTFNQSAVACIGSRHTKMYWMSGNIGLAG